MIVREGSDVNMRCVAKGSPIPSITWKREGGDPIHLPDGSHGKQQTEDLSEYRNTSNAVFSASSEFRVFNRTYLLKGNKVPALVGPSRTYYTA